jgi:tripeptide aminopeptidase
MMAIPGKSGQEQRIAEFIVGQLLAAGIDKQLIQFDTAHKKSPFGGDVGNLIVKLPGTIKGPRRLLMGHIDTVPLCVGSKPVRKGDLIKSSDPRTALGGDNRAGAAVVLSTILKILKQDLPHPPLTLFWPVQEEVGLVGARHVQLSKLGSPKLCFNWDGGAPNAAVIGATGADHLEITVHGLASHAGAHPEDGISAIAIASAAIAELQATGWHGKIVQGKKEGTSNIGYITGGEATNVVCDQVRLLGECRSHDPKFRVKIVEAFLKAFAKAAKSHKNAAGKTGSVDFSAESKYESFRLDEQEPVVQEALTAIGLAGLTPLMRVINGGLDANWMTRHGFPTVTLGCGQDGIHTVNEVLDVNGYVDACRIALLLATATTA